jgi:predicted Na+-dependent transporter
MLAFLASNYLKKDPATIFFTINTKNRSVASAIALSSFTELAALPLAISIIVDSIVNIFVTKRFKKKR